MRLFAVEPLLEHKTTFFMTHPMTLTVVTVLSILFCLPQMAKAQSAGSLEERGYQALATQASYAFYNDLDELTNGGTFENVTAGYRSVEGAYEIIIDFGWMEEILYIDFIDLIPAGSVEDGIVYTRSVYGDGREEVIATINIGKKVGVYSDEKNVVP